MYWGRLEQFPQDPKHFLQLNIVLAHATLDSVDLPSKVVVASEHLTEVHECPDYLNARPNRRPAPQHVGKHHRTVFREHMRRVFDILPTLQGHNLRP
jgi:hypothetical protein